MVGIYKITSPSGKIYIGQSRDINRRHNVDYKNHNCINQLKLYNSIKKYGWSSHIPEILQELPVDINGSDLNRLEEEFITFYKEAGYNMMNVKKKGSNWSGIHSESAIDRIRKGNTGKAVSEETRIKLSKVHKGKVISEEQKEKLRTCNLGRKQSSEEIEKRRSKNIGKKRTKEFCIHLSEVRKGIVFSEEHIKNLSLSHKGKPNPRKGLPGKKLGKQKIVSCPYCSFVGGQTPGTRFHFDKCKQKPQ